MKSFFSLLATVVFAAVVFGANLQWNAIWALATAVAGALTHNLYIQHSYADSAWERVCTMASFAVTFFVGLVLGVYAIAAYNGIGDLNSDFWPIAGLISFAAFAIGAIFSWLSSPPEAAEEVTVRRPV